MELVTCNQVTIDFFVIFIMKSIVVSTDFSASAENAMLYAGKLAKDINASILLVHVYQIPVGMNDMPVLVVPNDELKQNSDSGLQRAKEILHSSFSDLEIKTKSSLGDVAEELNDVCKDEQALFIVAGKHGANGMERVLFGSTSLSIIRHSKIPVIVVPASSQQQGVRKIALAVDNSGMELPVSGIKNIVEELNAQLEVIHVQQGKTESPNLTNIVSGLGASCTTIRDDEFVHGIEKYIQNNNIGLLMVLPHKHSFIERLFSTTHTSELLYKIGIPMMCVSS